MENLSSYAIIVILTILSGVADAQGFLFAAQIWSNGTLVWAQLLRSALGFAVGIGLYWLALRNSTAVGITSPEIQTVMWFAVTIIGVALISGNFLKRTLVDQALAIIVLSDIGWLIVRTAH